MIKTVRLSYFFTRQKDDNWDNLRMKVIDLLLNKYKIPMGYGSEKYEGWHIGNYCFVYVKEDAAKEIVSIYPQFAIDMKFNFLEKSDIESFKVGDSVMVGGMFGNSKGKVYTITENELVIKKFHSQTKGWKFKVGYQFDVMRI